MDVLADALSSLRLTGGVFLDGEFAAPWAVLSHIGPEHCASFFDAPNHVIAYHLVRSGWMSCQVGDGPRVRVNAGEIVLLPHNDLHFLYGPLDCVPVNAADIVQPPDADGIIRLHLGEDGERTSMYCGYLGTRIADDMLLRSLPAMMVVALDAAQDDWMLKSIAFAAEGIGAHSPDIVARLAETLFTAGVRRYAEAMQTGEGGWISGLRDPAVGKALTLIHGRYSEGWTVEDLARESGVSKTVLTDRFRALIGEAPMQYCGRWRMRVAANMLRDERQNACSVAYSVGFNSEAAFNRAFKREYGVPPATWSREARAA